ncbi:hypothetical protein L484_027909 [Morus notabilis]|uniref:Uncharacterized protein n=1 Tax=Morus notabilis TaxID=981085 RepID=W9SHX7_9ROSA|nr:hypothetical protein L484_027909 [Morus notabilis]
MSIVYRCLKRKWPQFLSLYDWQIAEAVAFILLWLASKTTPNPFKSELRVEIVELGTNEGPLALEGLDEWDFIHERGEKLEIYRWCQDRHRGAKTVVDEQDCGSSDERHWNLRIDETRSKPVFVEGARDNMNDMKMCFQFQAYENIDKRLRTYAMFNRMDRKEKGKRSKIPR